jgi:hypothetical protein
VLLFRHADSNQEGRMFVEVVFWNAADGTVTSATATTDSP